MPSTTRSSTRRSSGRSAGYPRRTSSDSDPSAEQLASVGARGLFGLYQGVPRTSLGADATPIPSKITIFRGPLRRAHPDPAMLEDAVEETVLHEIAHHFGLSDARLIELRRGDG